MGHGITAQNATAIVALIAVFSATGCVCQLAPAPLEKNTLRVCVVERAPFSLCSVSKASPQEWPKSYQVDLFKRIVDDLDDESVKAAFQPNWQCVGRTTAELIAELGRPQGSRSCDIAIAPITINEERKLTIDFITGVHFTFSVPIAAADDLGVGNEMAFWLKPFKAEAWWANLGM
jgi:ABC-type amino acid transport substrate-binding protein